MKQVNFIGRFASASLALAVLSSTAVMAADRAPQQPYYDPTQPIAQPRAQPLVLPTPKSWNSCYVGVNAGQWNNTTSVNPKSLSLADGFPYPVYLNKSDSTVHITQTGLNLGAVGGCDYDNGQYVWGWQGNINYTPNKPDTGHAVFTDPWSNTVRVTNHVAAGAALRLGKAYGDTLVYGKLGVTVAPYRFHQVFSQTSLNYENYGGQNGIGIQGQSYPSSFMSTTWSDGTRWLWAPKVGLGVEHMLSADTSVVAEVEASYFYPQRSNFTLIHGSFGNSPTNGAGTNWHPPANGKWGYVATSLLTTFTLGVNQRF